MKKYNIKKIKQHKNAQEVRLDNRRISVGFNPESPEKICVVMQSILPPEDLSFKGNFIRGNYKQTAFALTEEAAISLLDSLGYVLQQKLNYQQNEG